MSKSKHELLHKLFRILPKFLSHSLIDLYILTKTNKFNRIYNKMGPDWMKRIPNFKASFNYDASDSIEKQISEFWRIILPDGGGGNSARDYANSKISWDIELVKKHADNLLEQNDTILDFGCNAGRVLHVFVESGYNGIGVEINPKAVEWGKKIFPSLANSKFYIGDGVEILKEIKTNSVDLIYTFAVLRHVSPENIGTITKELSRISKKYIITMEDEGSLSYRTFPRNYRNIFHAFEYKQILKEYAIDHCCPIDVGGLGTVLRIFEKII